MFATKGVNAHNVLIRGVDPFFGLGGQKLENVNIFGS